MQFTQIPNAFRKHNKYGQSHNEFSKKAHIVEVL